MVGVHECSGNGPGGRHGSPGQAVTLTDHFGVNDFFFFFFTTFPLAKGVKKGRFLPWF